MSGVKLLSNPWLLTPATMACHLSKGMWLHAKHLSLIAQQVAYCAYRALRDKIDTILMIELPPRHGKSNLISCWSPVWILTHFPWAHILLVSYNSNLATTFGRAARDRMFAHQAALSRAVRRDLFRPQHWGLESGGLMYAEGIHGSLTGKGGHVLILDDLIKNWQEAHSIAEIQSMMGELDSSVLTRSEPGSLIIACWTRWTINDPGEWLRAQYEGDIRVIKIPAIADPMVVWPDPLGRQAGEALWPERYPAEVLLNIKNRRPHVFEALYQQNPTKAFSIDANSGNLVQIQEIPFCSRWVRFWDLAATEKKRRRKTRSGKDPDWTVGVLMGEPINDPSNVVIADIRRLRGNPSTVEKAIRLTAEHDTPSVPICIEREPGSSGYHTIHQYDTKVLPEFSVTGIPVDTDISIRAQMFLASVDQNRVQIAMRDWTSIFCQELDSYPGGRHDDQISAAAGAYNYLKDTHASAGTFGREMPSAAALKGSMAWASEQVSGMTWGRIL